MRIPNEIHLARPWRFSEIAPDFELEDAWDLPARGGPDDFPELLRVMDSLDPSEGGSLPTRVLWRTRELLGKIFRLDPDQTSTTGDEVVPLPIPDSDETSLAERLPDDLRGSVSQLPDRKDLLFTPVFVTEDEYVGEISNKTVHGVIQLSWIDRGDGVHQGRMAIYVKPRGRLGRFYMKAIGPFRHLIVYPALMRQIERSWSERTLSKP